MCNIWEFIMGLWYILWEVEELKAEITAAVVLDAQG
jgi:hypothetical protein